MSVLDTLRAERLVAKRYEERGYTVTVEPPQSIIPFDVGNYKPDILATNGKEWLLIDVKAPGARVNLEMYKAVARTVGANPGWNFLLVTLSREDLEDPDRAGFTDATTAALRERLEKLDHLRETERSADLLLPLYWGAYIAALRLVVEQEGIQLGAITELSLVNKSYTEGIVFFEHYESARHLLSLRNLAIHSLEAVVPDDASPELRKLIDELVDRLTSPDH